MKVLVISNLYPPDVVGGYELGCAQMVQSMQAAGIDVRVAATVPRIPVPETSQVHRVFELSDNWSRSLNASRNAAQRALHITRSHHVNSHNVYALLREVDEFDPDVVYLWSLEGIGGLGIVATLRHIGMPWVWHLMDRMPLMLCSNAHGPIPALVEQFNRSIRGAYIACSQTVLDEIADGGISIADEVQVVPNWVEGPHKRIRTRYVEDGRLRVMHAVAQLSCSAGKGTDLLVTAAARLRADGYENFGIDLYGNTPDQSIPHLILSLGLQDHIRLLGWRSQEELKELHADYDMFAFPTRAREPFGFAPLEAAASGCVPLISQVCGISEWFVHGVHALKCESSPDDIARILKGALDGHIKLADIGARAATVVRRDFHIDAVTSSVVRVLDRAAAKPRDAGGSPDEAFRMAKMAERLAQVSIRDRACA